MENKKWTKVTLILKSGKVTKMNILDGDVHPLIKNFTQGIRDVMEITKSDFSNETESSCFIRTDDISIIDLG